MIKPIETFYNGRRYRSRLEARWAVYLDAIGAVYAYEPEGFTFKNGLCYLPDFRIDALHSNGRNDYSFYLEVKGELKEDDLNKFEEFYQYKQLLVVGDIYKKDRPDAPEHILNYWPEYKFPFNGFVYVDGDDYPCMLAAGIGGCVGLYGPDWYEGMIDEEKTLKAIRKAAQARFEYGETPKINTKNQEKEQWTLTL